MAMTGHGFEGLSHTRYGTPALWWPYLDAQGTPLCAVARFEDRDGNKTAVLPAVRNGHGWHWGAPPGLRPLYGLDRLAARAGARVLLVEGEKSADAARTLFPDHVTMAWQGGCGAVDKADLAPLKNRDVVLWPDNDAPGRKATAHMAERLRGLARSVALVDVPGSWPPAWDVADPPPDSVTAETLGAMMRDARPAGPAEREPPRPLVRATPPAEPFPVDALGPDLAAAARAIEALTQAPLALCGQAVLGAAALAAQPHADTLMPDGRRRPLSLALLSIAASGERKTTVDGHALREVREHERRLQEAYEIDLGAHKNDHAAWQATRGSPKGKNRDAIRASLEAAGPEPVPPRKPFILASEPTIEGLLKLLADGQPSMGLFSAEGSTFIGGHGMSDDARLRTAGALSRLWDDGTADRVRATDGAIKLYGRRLSVHLATQPGNGLAWLALSDLEDQGLFSRLLCVAPASTIGTRFLSDETDARAGMAAAGLDRFHARIASLLRTTPKVVELEPRPLPMSPAAARLWRDFNNAVEAAMSEGGELAAVRAFANKAGEHVVRIAGVRTIYADTDAAEIADAAVAGAIDLVQHYLAEAMRLRGMAGECAHLRRAQEVLDFIKSIGRPVVHLAEIYQQGPAQTRDAAAAREAMHILADHGHVEAIEGGATVGGRRRREAWRIVTEG